MSQSGLKLSTRTEAEYRAERRKRHGVKSYSVGYGGAVVVCECGEVCEGETGEHAFSRYEKHCMREEAR